MIVGRGLGLALRDLGQLEVSNRLLLFLNFIKYVFDSKFSIKLFIPKIASTFKIFKEIEERLIVPLNFKIL